MRREGRVMGWHRCDEESRADRYHDARKHDFPLHAEPKPMTTAMEIAVLVKAVDLTMGAELIERYVAEVKSRDRLEAVAAGARP